MSDRAFSSEEIAKWKAAIIAEARADGLREAAKIVNKAAEHGIIDRSLLFEIVAEIRSIIGKSAP